MSQASEESILVHIYGQIENRPLSLLATFQGSPLVSADELAPLLRRVLKELEAGFTDPRIDPDDPRRNNP